MGILLMFTFTLFYLPFSRISRLPAFVERYYRTDHAICDSVKILTVHTCNNK
jgi:hypothetical protein